MKKNYQDDDDDSPLGDDDNSNHYEALSVFCNRYVPADEQTMTGMFSTKEIQKLIIEHVGVKMEISEICELLITMHYKYKLDEGNFLWMVKES